MGFIGGKTQTDLAAMDDLYLDGNARNAGFSDLMLTFIFSAWYYG